MGIFISWIIYQFPLSASLQSHTSPTPHFHSCAWIIHNSPSFLTYIEAQTAASEPSNDRHKPGRLHRLQPASSPEPIFISCQEHVRLLIKTNMAALRFKCVISFFTELHRHILRLLVILRGCNLEAARYAFYYLWCCYYVLAFPFRTSDIIVCVVPLCFWLVEQMGGATNVYDYSNLESNKYIFIILWTEPQKGWRGEFFDDCF